MKAINNEQAQVFEVLMARHNETTEEFRDIIEALLKLDGLKVELCGSWLWIGGNTTNNKEALKAAGCRWSPNRKMWYWRPWHSGNRQASETRTKYGSQVFEAAGETTGYTRIGATA